MSIASRSGSPCSKDGAIPPGAVLVPLEQWRAMGKPYCAEEYQDFLSRLSQSGDRREHERIDKVLGVRLSRLPSASPIEFEDTSTENLSRGGARVSSRMGAAVGDVLLFQETSSRFSTRVQIQDVTRVGGSRSRPHDEKRRLHLRFLDAQPPDALFTT
jgi:hypothetical protein